MSENKNILAEEVKENEETKELSLEDLSEVSGGAAFANIPRVPTKKIDSNLREKI